MPWLSFHVRTTWSKSCDISWITCCQEMINFSPIFHNRIISHNLLRFRRQMTPPSPPSPQFSFHLYITLSWLINHTSNSKLYTLFILLFLVTVSVLSTNIECDMLLVTTILCNIYTSVITRCYSVWTLITVGTLHQRGIKAHWKTFNLISHNSRKITFSQWQK